MVTSKIQLNSKSPHFGTAVSIINSINSGYVAPNDGIVQVYSHVGEVADYGYDEYTIAGSGERGIRINGLKSRYVTGCALIRKTETFKYHTAGNINERKVLFIPFMPS